MGFLLLGIDSLIACLAVAAIVDARWRLPLAAMFGIADGVSFLIGAGLGWQLSAGLTAVVETGTLLLLGVYLIVVAASTRGIAARWGVWILPFALIFDNLAFGIADDSSRSVLAQATEQALSSALMAAVGLMSASCCRGSCRRCARARTPCGSPGARSSWRRRARAARVRLRSNREGRR